MTQRLDYTAIALAGIKALGEVAQNPEVNVREGQPLTTVAVTQCNLVVAVYVTMMDGKLIRFEKYASSSIKAEDLVDLAYNSAKRSERVEVGCDAPVLKATEPHSRTDLQSVENQRRLEGLNYCSASGPPGAQPLERRPPMSIDQRRMSARSLTLTGILCITAACSGQADAPQTVGPEVDVMTLQPQSTMLTTEVPGHTSAFLRAEVRPQVTGAVLQRQFEEGTDVRAGQVLYQIDPQTYQVAFNSAKAGLALAEALAARLRVRRPADPKAIEQQDDDTDVEYKLAQADVVAAREALDRARIDLAATRITAPISGRIGRSTVTSGDLVTAGQPTPLATVLQIDPIYVDVTMSSTDIQHVMQERTSGKQQQAGAAPAQVWLRLSDGIEYAYAGKLQFPEVPTLVGKDSVIVRAVFPNPEGLLLPGMSVRLQTARAATPSRQSGGSCKEPSCGLARLSSRTR
jgi:membrane fusion protein, multidrug efflux system